MLWVVALVLDLGPWFLNASLQIMERSQNLGLPSILLLRYFLKHVNLSLKAKEPELAKPKHEIGHWCKDLLLSPSLKGLYKIMITYNICI